MSLFHLLLRRSLACSVHQPHECRLEAGAPNQLTAHVAGAPSQARAVTVFVFGSACARLCSGASGSGSFLAVLTGTSTFLRTGRDAGPALRSGSGSSACRPSAIGTT